MTKIVSNKPLKYDLIKSLEGIIELKIIEVRDFIENEASIITIQDSVHTESGIQVLNTRQKQFSFAELDALAEALYGSIDATKPYMERRQQLLQAGLLYVTQNDANPIYFSSSADWEIPVMIAPPEETPTEGGE